MQLPGKLRLVQQQRLSLLLLVAAQLSLVSCRQLPAGQLRQSASCPDGFQLTASACIQHGTAQGAPEPRSTGFRPVRRRPATGGDSALVTAGMLRNRQLLQGSAETSPADDRRVRVASSSPRDHTERSTSMEIGMNGHEGRARNPQDSMKDRQKTLKRRQQKKRKQGRRKRKDKRRRPKAGRIQVGEVEPVASATDTQRLTPQNSAPTTDTPCPTWIDRRGRCRLGRKKRKNKKKKDKKRGRGRKGGKNKKNRRHNKDTNDSPPKPIFAFADPKLRLLTPLQPQWRADGSPGTSDARPSSPEEQRLMPDHGRQEGRHRLSGSGSQPQPRRLPAGPESEWEPHGHRSRHHRQHHNQQHQEPSQLQDSGHAERTECLPGSSRLQGGMCVRCRVRPIPKSGRCPRRCGQAFGRCACCNRDGDLP